MRNNRALLHVALQPVTLLPSRSCASTHQAVRPPQHNDDSEEVDDKTAELRHVIFAHHIGDAERKLAQPLTLKVMNASKDTTFAELARNSPLGKNAVSHLRLINGLYPTGEPLTGLSLKVIE